MKMRKKMLTMITCTLLLVLVAGLVAQAAASTVVLSRGKYSAYTGTVGLSTVGYIYGRCDASSSDYIYMSLDYSAPGYGWATKYYTNIAPGAGLPKTRRTDPTSGSWRGFIRSGNMNASGWVEVSTS